jgi:TolB protein
VPRLGPLLRLGAPAVAVLATTASAAPSVPGRLAVVQGGDDSRLVLMHPDGSNARTLVSREFGLQSPTWQPDGRAVAFTSSRGGGPAVYLVNDDGTGLRLLTGRRLEARDPAFSPNGRLAFVRGGDLVVARADGSNPRRLVKAGLENHSPSWALDGRRLAFVRERHDFGADLYVLDVSRATARRLTTGSTDISPAWSPDGRWIAFVRRGLTDDRGHLYLVRPDGRDVHAASTRFADVTDVAWSPDSHELVFTRKIAPDSELFRLEFGSGRVRKVTRNAIADTEPAWGPRRR